MFSPLALVAFICHALSWWSIASLQLLQVNAFVIHSSPVITINKRPAASKIAMSKDSTPQNEALGQMLGGLVFLKTADRRSLVDFYTQRLGMSLWLEQPSITILNHGNMILGFHQIQNSEDQTDLQGMYTKEHVDDMHNKLHDVADGKPRHNVRHQIYQFFAKDPEGRNLEFQAFLHPLTEVISKVTK